VGVLKLAAEDALVHLAELVAGPPWERSLEDVKGVRVMQVGRQAQAVPRVLEDEDAGVKALAIVRQEREGPVGRAAHATHPLVEAKTDDGPRLLAGHPLVTDPVDLDGPTLDPDRWVDERCELIDGAQRSVERPRADLHDADVFGLAEPRRLEVEHDVASTTCCARVPKELRPRIIRCGSCWSGCSI
jgi:hypothetical protein